VKATIFAAIAAFSDFLLPYLFIFLVPGSPSWEAI
jgi:hypothetical protein